MERLHELLTVRRAEVIRRWTESINRTLAPGPMTRLELVDHLPGFLDEVTSILRRAADGNTPPAETPTAAEHGVQRLRLGFDLEALVREYGILRRCIIDLANDEGLQIGAADFDILFECLISGIADAVTQYTEERDAEHQRQANEHFGFIAHELRNPLSTALLALSSLQEKGLLPANRQAEILGRSMTRMSDLVQHTLSLALVGSGIQLRRERLNLHTLVAEASAEAVVEAEEKGVQLIVQSGGSDETIDADHRLIVSALNNLIRNAVKFTGTGFTVRVRWHRESGLARFEVEDECGGLPPGKTEELFAPFVQAGKDRSGFGLGLAIARQAAEAHGGTVRVRDLPKKGCVFTLELPSP